MKAMNVAFCVNNAYVNHLIVTIYSLLAHNKTGDIHIHILSSDITEDSKCAIDILKQLHKGLRVSYYSVNPSDFDGVSMTMDYITRETFYRLMLADILPTSVNRVLYLDADILVIGKVNNI